MGEIRKRKLLGRSARVVEATTAEGRWREQDRRARERGRKKAVLASWYKVMDENEERQRRLALPGLKTDFMDERPG